jgi:Asp-tRNA(Asn)/Glu-tRNA(Gln) amidotransferase A subunit family amidase
MDLDEQSVTNVRKAGVVILTNVNTPEFGAGGNTTKCVYGPLHLVHSHPKSQNL